MHLFLTDAGKTGMLKSPARGCIVAFYDSMQAFASFGESSARAEFDQHSSEPAASPLG